MGIPRVRERAGDHKFKAAQRGEFSFGVRAAFDENWIVGTVAAHRNGGIDCDGGRAWNGSEAILDFLLHAKGGFVALDLRIGNGDVKGLKLFGVWRIRD